MAPRPQVAKTLESRRRNPAAPVIDREQIIVDLEAKLKLAEEQMQDPGISQDLAEMTRLAEEHAETQAELQKQLEEWEDE